MGNVFVVHVVWVLVCQCLVGVLQLKGGDVGGDGKPLWKTVQHKLPEVLWPAALCRCGTPQNSLDHRMLQTQVLTVSCEKV